MDGVLNVLKPPGMTSFDVINYLRKKLNIQKAGHTGTLDPGAVGVLPVCFGKATRVAEYLTQKVKAYRAELTLGINTDTQDSFGKVVSQREVDVTLEQIQQVLLQFIGRQEQLPPMYSAVKINGKKLYELARQGIETKRKTRTIVIHNIRLVRYMPPDKLLIDVECSAGTYIRTLCQDIGEALGCGGHMSFLLRTASGSFRLEEALTLEEIIQSENWKNKLVPVEQILDMYPKIYLEAIGVKGFRNGAQVSVGELPEYESTEQTGTSLFRVYQPDGVFLGTGKAILCEGRVLLKVDKLFCQAGNVSNE